MLDVNEVAVICRGCRLRVVVGGMVEGLDTSNYTCIDCRVAAQDRLHDSRPISPETWQQAEVYAAEKDRRAADMPWTRDLSPFHNLTGRLGEKLYSAITGIPCKDTFGDGGTDFPGVDAKATVYVEDPWLRVFTSDKMVADWFACVAVDMKARRARYVGYASRAEVLAGEVRELVPKHPSYILPPAQLTKGLPPCSRKSS